MTLTCSTYPLTRREQDSIAPRDTSLISHDAHVRGRLRMAISTNKSSWKFWDVLYFSVCVCVLYIYIYIFFSRFFQEGNGVGSCKGDKSCQRAIVSQ